MTDARSLLRKESIAVKLTIAITLAVLLLWLGAFAPGLDSAGYAGAVTAVPASTAGFQDIYASASLAPGDEWLPVALVCALGALTAYSRYRRTV